MPHKVALNLETKKERLERKGKAAVSNDYHGVFGAERYFRSAANTKATNGRLYTALLKVPTLLRNRPLDALQTLGRASDHTEIHKK